MRRETKIKKLVEIYCKRQGYSAETMKFIYRGNVIKGNETPDSLKMDPGVDEMECVIDQYGGGYFC